MTVEAINTTDYLDKRKQVCQGCKKEFIGPVFSRFCDDKLCQMKKKINNTNIEEKRRCEEDARMEQERKKRLNYAFNYWPTGLNMDKRTFGNFKPTEKNHLAFNSAENWKSGKGLCFSGPTGTGKTHLMCALANKVAFQPATLQIIRFGSFCINFHASPFDRKEEMLSGICKCGYLFIDDIGSEKLSEFTTSILTDIIDYRLEWNKPTFATTNLSPDGLSQFMTPRLLSRFAALVEFVSMEGQDWRTNL